MRIAYFDTFSGISGDMTLGACLHAGVSLDSLKNELTKIPITGYEITERKIVRSMISATKVDVQLHQDETHHHAHDSLHDHHHEHDDSHRSYSSIKNMIENSGLNDHVKEMSLKIFLAIAKAEAKIHDVPVNDVHFHEVGAIDSIIDIVGICICLDLLQIEKIFSTPVRTGSGGFINTQHGTMPIPTPATIEILKNYPTELTNIPFELTTPTGAAIIAALSDGLLPASKNILIDSIGYGAGGREIPQTPNLLRLIIGRIDDDYHHDEIVSVETNIDDMNPEIYPYVIEKLLRIGAHDAYLIPIIMKKGRPGILLSCLCSKSILEEILRVVYQETTTLGVRIQEINRKKIAREIRVVETSFGTVSMKVLPSQNGERLIPEYEECKRIAEKFSLPLREIYLRIEHESAK